MKKNAKPTVAEPIAPLTVHLAFAAVMQAIKPIEKLSENKGQGFWFRGIDDVMANLQPIFAAHGVGVIPGVPTSANVSVIGKNSKNNDIFCATVILPYTIIGPQGDSISGGSAGSAFDSGDKAMAKAMTMAFKSFLTQAFTIPTYETPDADSYDPTCIPRGDAEDITKLSDEELDRRIQQIKGEQTAALKSDNTEDIKSCIQRRTVLEDEQQRRSDEARKLTPPAKTEQTTEKATRAPRKSKEEPETPPAAGEGPQGAVGATSAAVSPTGDWREAVFENLPVIKWNGIKLGEIPAEAIAKMKRGWVDKYAENISQDPIKKHTATVLLAAYKDLVASGAIEEAK